MKAGNWKLLGILALLMAFALAISGCDTGVDVEPDPHGLKISVNPSNDLVEIMSEEVGILTVEDNIAIDDVVVELYAEGDDPEEDEPEHAKTKAFTEFHDTYEFTFEDVSVGTYDVYARLDGTIRDEPEKKPLYRGEETSVLVEADTITDDVEITVKPLDWKRLEVTLRDDSEIEDIIKRLDEVKLVHPLLGHSDTDDSANFVDGDTVTFDVNYPDDGIGDGDRVPSRWHLFLKFDGEDIANPDAIELLLLPTEAREIELEIKYTKGRVIVDVDVRQSPKAPKNLRIVEGYLKWDVPEDTDTNFYTILRTETEDPPEEGEYFEPVGTTEEEEFLMIGKKPGYYWVRGYDEAGYSSDVEGPVHVEDMITGAFYDGTLYDTIQEAIDAAAGAETTATSNTEEDPVVLVGPGIYDEDVTVNVEGLTLQSTNGRNETTIEGQVGGEVGALSIEASDVTVDGFEIKGQQKTVRIPVPTSGVSFINNKVVTGDNVNKENAWAGFEVHWDQEQSGLVIDNNIFVANTTAQLVYANKATDVQFTNNEIEGEMWAPGVVVALRELEEGWDISGNTFDTYSEYALLEVDEGLDMDALLAANYWPQGGEIYENKIVNEIVDAVYNVRKEEFYDEIQTAINDAQAEDTLLVYPGNYDENITIELAGLTLESVKDREAVIEDKISIKAANVTLTGFELQSRISGGSSADDITLIDNLITGLNLAPADHAFTSNHRADGVHTFRNNVIDHMLNVDNSSANYIFENNTIKGFLANARPKENYTFEITDNEFIDGGGIAFGEADGERIIENNNFLENSFIWILEGVTVTTSDNYWIDGLENMVSGDGDVVGDPVDDKIDGIGADWY